MFKKEYKDKTYIFTNVSDNTKIKIMHYEDEHSFDYLFINREYKLDFVDYVIKELIKTNDVGICMALYDSSKLEEILFANGFKVSNYEYEIPFKKYNISSDYEVSNNLDDGAKKFYLDFINKEAKINQKYFNPNTMFKEYTETIFKNNNALYRIYRKNKKVIGIVSYEIPSSYLDNAIEVIDIFNYNNKICIKNIFAETKEIKEYILKDLLNKYKKNMIINHTYTDLVTKKVISKFNAEFKFCTYVSDKL